MAQSTAGTTICVTKSGAVGVSIVPTGASKAAPSVVTTTSTETLENGSLIWLADDSTGLSELDGNWFIVSGLVADTSFELLGSDASASTGTFVAGTPMHGYDESDMQCLCLSEITFNRDTPDTISIGTFCDPTASMAGSVVQAGTVDFGGYVDISENDYKELLKLEDTQEETVWRITLPNNGYIVFPAVISQITWDIPLEGAVAYSGTAVLKSEAEHLF